MKQGESSGSPKPRDRDRDRDRSAVSIKIIETQTVQTDAAHFKSVVQCLTGKDSPAVGTGKGPESSGTTGTGAGQKKGEGGGGREGKGEFDDILKMKLPSVEELKEFWDE